MSSHGSGASSRSYRTPARGLAEHLSRCLRGARFATEDASQKQLQQKDVVHMAMADNPISRRNFLYGMVGTGAALTIGRRVAGFRPTGSPGRSEVGPVRHSHVHELGLSGSYDTGDQGFRGPATPRFRYSPVMYRR